MGQKSISTIVQGNL